METNDKINFFIRFSLLDPTKSSLQRHMHDGTIAEWSQHDDCFAIALYPEVVLRSGRSTTWVSSLLTNLLKEYEIFEGSQEEGSIVHDTAPFDRTFQVLWKQSLKQREGSGFVANRNDSELKQKTLPKKKTGKEKRVWGEAKVTREAMAELDFSKEPQNSDEVDDKVALDEARAAYLPASDEIPAWEEDDKLDDLSSSSQTGWGSSLKGLLDQMSGNKVLTADDLEGPLNDMQRLLTSKNVANDIAKRICDGVKTKLVGKRMQSFARVKTAVRQALESAIAKILVPSKSREVDVLRAAVAKRDGSILRSKLNNPYVIVMVGINGVGKSTSLAKIAYYLKSNGCNPLVAACDTFRSGAVEQLMVHAKTLQVPLYHKGYAKDPSAVAKAAISQAADDGHDVVLVDTAGRMQNNVPLMKALSKLVVENQPDLVLFVCEALVGNDGIDQLSMFNSALRSGGHKRQIDGIVLTKFDTVSDKVGAALTMTHVTGAPVVFIGTGQKYNHLKKLSVQAVIKSMFS